MTSQTLKKYIYHSQKTTLIGICLICFISVSFDTNGQTFEYTDPRDKSSEALALIATEDHLFVGGRLEPENWYYSVPYLIRLSNDGDTISTTLMESNKEGQDQIVSLIAMKNDRIGVLSETDKLMKVSQINPDGEEMWSYTDEAIEHPVAMTVTDKNELVACGSCQSDNFNEGRNTVCVVKIDAKGKAVWRTFAGTGERVKPYGLTTTPSGEVILVMKHRVQQREAPLLLRIDKRGKMKGNISLGAADLDEVFDITTDLDGNIYLTGEGKSASKPALVKFNDAGELQWQRIYEGESGSYRAYSMALDDDKGFVLAGRTHDARGFLIKTDDSGKQQWRKTFSGIEKAGFKKVVLTENGYVLAGVTLSGNESKVYCLKVDKNGDL